MYDPVNGLIILAFLFGGLLVVFLISVLFIRWIFRINEQIALLRSIFNEISKHQTELLPQIRDELKKLNSGNQSSA